ncbi:hypothetical protein HOLleu_35065 [Holothuria leucospilota]|uniref:Uncharacterized protein n=1 Tax=Holothuria leucospilota TaxID=206669 RepID=A0A9Q0YP84_HOLLE|nr:hypothetical protein HOLleu_35065 [Holothuria leucospilota]
MTSQIALTLALLALAMATVRGLPTGMVWREEADAITPSFVTERSFLQKAISEVRSLEDVPSSQGVPTSDEKKAENERQERSITSPPEVRLEEWQIKEILNAKESMTLVDSTIVGGRDQPIVNLTEEQIAKLLPYYRELFHRPSQHGVGEQPSPSSEPRARRSTQQRICPADPVVTQPQLAVNSNGQTVQIVQLNSVDMTQVFFEERCLHETSPISSATCVQSTRFVTALVIDLQTQQIKQQAIGIQSCVGVLNI